jgi:CRISPR system Cascade subunit CasD
VEFLVFQLRAPLSSWGDVAIGEYRGSYEHPSESALIGLLGAALGIRRENEHSHAALRTSLVFAVGIQSSGKLLRDYHTAQVPGRVALKGRPHATRKHELSVPKDDLGTILSTRDYRQDGAALIAIQSRPGAQYSLEELAQALRRPRFTLYLGRKSCPPSAPLYPQVIATDCVRTAFAHYLTQIESLRAAHQDRWNRLPLEPVAKVVRLFWSEGAEAGVPADFSVPRKDRLIRRQGWQFTDRVEHTAALGDD